MEETKKIGFFKRLKMSIFELENYIQFTAESLGKAIGFMFKMTVLFAIIIVLSNVAYVYGKYNSPVKYVDAIVPKFSYDKKELIIDEQDKEIKEKKTIAVVMKELEPTYREVIPDGNYTKDDLLKFVEENETKLVIMMASAIFIESILDMFIFWMSIALLTAMIGLIVLRFSRIKMKFSKLYSLAIYASNLSMILTVVYTLLNTYFNIYIDVFDYLSMLIAYVYITAVIYMIRSDLVKQQLELIKIATVQAQVKEQLEKEKQEEEEKEKEKENGKPEEKPEAKPEDKPDDGEIINDEPDGSEI